MNQPVCLPITVDITDVTGQLNSGSERIYRHDAEVFACWMYDQRLTLGTLHLLTRSHLIAYRKYLGETYAKATAARMFSVARPIAYIPFVIGLPSVTVGLGAILVILARIRH
jgi:hypothetical protein